VVPGFFDELPVPDDSADLVIACSSFTPDPAHGGEAGLEEMERCCRPGGRVVIVWPYRVEWLLERGYHYLSFPGELNMEFASLQEAIELAKVFYPEAVPAIRERGRADVPYCLLGQEAPRDLAFKVKPSR
jgi:SAM-dependent methyltransferase